MALTVYHSLETIDKGFTGPLTGGYVPRLQFGFDEADFIADTNEFRPEVVADNTTGTNRVVQLIRTDNLDVMEEITVPANTNAAKRFSSGLITWPVGPKVYSWQPEGVGGSTPLKLYAGRINCKHENPEALKLWHSAICETEGVCDGLVNQIDLLNSVGVTIPLRAGIYTRNDSEFDAGAMSWGLETVIGKSGFTIIMDWGLYNTTLGAVVAASSFTSAVDIVTLAEKKWSADPNFVNGHKFRWYWKDNTLGLGTGKVHGGRIYIYLTGGINKLTTRLRTARGSGSSVLVTNTTSRIFIFSGSSELVGMRAETSAYASSGNTGLVDQVDDATNDSGAGGSIITGARITVTDEYKNHMSGVYTVTDNDRLYEKDSPVAGSLVINWVHVLQDYLASVAAAVCNDDVSTSIDGTTLTVTGTATGTNAVNWRVVEVISGTVMDSGAGDTANWSFAGAYGVTYQVQFQDADDNWSSDGCTFSFGEPAQATDICCIVNSDLDSIAGPFAAMSRYLSMVRGRKKTFSFAVVNPDGSPYDLTGKIVAFGIKRQTWDAAVFLGKVSTTPSFTITTPTSGRGTFTIDPPDTVAVNSWLETFVAELAVYTNPSDIEGMWRGTLDIYPNVI